MIHALKEVQGDENIVGFYQTTSVPLRQSFVDTQATDYQKLRHGGIVIVHGAFRSFVPTFRLSCEIFSCISLRH
jgi:translation initiation factor 3 subunit H